MSYLSTYIDEVWPPVCFEHIEEPELTRAKGTTEIWVGGKSASEVDQNCMLVRGELRFQVGVGLKRGGYEISQKFFNLSVCVTIVSEGNLSAEGALAFDILAISCQASPRLLRGIPKPTAALTLARSGT